MNPSNVSDPRSQRSWARWYILAVILIVLFSYYWADYHDRQREAAEARARHERELQRQENDARFWNDLLTPRR